MLRHSSKIEAAQVAWLEELELRDAEDCLRIVYLRDEPPERAQVQALIDAVVDGNYRRTMILLAALLVQADALDSVEYLFSRLTAHHQLAVLIASKGSSPREDQCERLLDKLFALLISKVTQLQFLQELQLQSSTAGMTRTELCERILARWRFRYERSDGIESSDTDLLVIEGRLASLRNILRFTELCLLQECSRCELPELAVSLYQKLEGYYSPSIDRVLKATVQEVLTRDVLNKTAIAKLTSTLRLVQKHRGEGGNEYVSQMTEFVENLARSKCDGLKGIAELEAAIDLLDPSDKAARLLLSTISGALIERFTVSVARGSARKASLRTSLSELMLSLALIWLIADAPKESLSILESMCDIEEQVSDITTLRIKVALAILRKVEFESDASRLLSSCDARAVLTQITRPDDTLMKFAFQARDKSVELFLDAGNVLGVSTTTSGDSHYLYAGAFFIYQHIPHPHANRLLISRLSEKLGGDLRGEKALQTIAEIRALDVPERKSKRRREV